MIRNMKKGKSPNNAAVTVKFLKLFSIYKGFRVFGYGWVTVGKSNRNLFKPLILLRLLDVVTVGYG